MRVRERTTVYFRCDASVPIGTGHVKRCITLANRLARYQVNCHFITRHDADGLSPQLIFPQFPYTLLPQTLTKTEEAIDLVHLMQPSRNSIVVVDSYEADEVYLKTIKKSGVPLAVIDDFAELSYYDCDLIVNQNAYADTLSYRTNPQTKILRGPDYALLREAFWLRRHALLGKARRHPALASRLLITMGGSDPARGTVKALRAINLLSEDLKRNIYVTVVLGPGFVDCFPVTEAIEGLNQVRLVQHSDRMSELMSEADLAITAGGGTVYELAALGVPSLIVAIADHQERVGLAMQERQAAVYLGRIGQVSENGMSQAIAGLMCDPFLRDRLSHTAFKLIDGQGAERVARYMLKELI